MQIVEIFVFEKDNKTKLPLYTMSVSAGRPVPAENDVERDIDLNEFLVEHPAATFFARVRGDSMTKAGITDDDVLIVDTSLDPRDGTVVVVAMNGDFTVKIYREIDGEVYLESQNDQFLPTNIGDDMELKPIGVVTKVIHSL